MEQLSGLDAAFVYFEAAGAAHVTSLSLCEPVDDSGRRRRLR